MFAIVGIGNPGSRYKNNRHNVGFQFLDYYAEKKSLHFKSSKFNYDYAEGRLFNNSFVLVKPVTYVNLSGAAVNQCLNVFNIDIHNLLVVVDDINLGLTELRLRKYGGDGGHNGLKSIIYHLNDNHFARIRIGIGKKFESGQLVDYVLSDFDSTDFTSLNKSFDLSIQLIESFILGGYNKMLSTFSHLKNLENKNKEVE